MHGLTGIAHTSEPGERPKGFFRVGDQTEGGYQAIFERMTANIAGHGYDPRTGGQVEVKQHIAVKEYIEHASERGSLHLHERERDYVATYRDTYGQSFQDAVDEVLGRIGKDQKRTTCTSAKSALWATTLFRLRWTA